ncbi:hypothetical protein Tco_1533048, partial [Tanacetum coccineum]
QFWNTMKYDKKTGVYSYQVDEQWFNLSADLLRNALEITPVDPAHPFELPLASQTVIDFVNQLGYPEPVEFVSNIRVNYVYQPWRAILSLINLCLTGKTSGNDKPRHPRIYYLASKNNIQRRPESAVHHTRDDFLLGNLKFVPKGETKEVFGMAIPKQLITEAIQQSSYYQKYLEMVAKNTKRDSTRTPAKQPKSPKKKPSKRIPTRKVRKGKIQFDLVDEEDIRQGPEPHDEETDPVLELAKKLSLDSLQEKGEGEGADADLERAMKMSLDSFQAQRQAPIEGVTIRERVDEEIQKLLDVEGKGKAIVTEEQAAHSLIDLSKKKSTTDQFILQRRDQAPHDSTIRPSSQPQDDTSEKISHKSSSITDSERTESGTEATAPKVDKERGKEASTIVTSEERMAVREEDQAGSDPEKGNESTEDQAGLDPGESHAALAGPDPEPMHDDFYATAYPDVHENPKLQTDEHVIVENPESPSGILSSMKNLDDTDTFGDQFLNDKLTEDDQDKSNVKAEIVSIIPDPSHQTDTPAPPVSTPVIDISSPQSSSHVNAPLLTATTEMTTTILALPPPLPSQSVTDSGLAARVVELEKRNAELERVFTIQNKMTNNLASRIFTLEHHDLEYRIDNYIRDAVKDFIQAALRAPILQGFQDLTENAPGSTQPPFKDFKQSTKKKPDSDTSAAQQPPAHTSSAWKITDTRDAPSGSLMHMSEPQSEQSCDDTPTPDDMHASDPEDADHADNNWANAFAKAHQDPDENKLHNKIDDIGSFIRWYCRRIGKEELSKADLEGPAFMMVKGFHENNISLQFQMEECHKLLTNQIDLVNPEGHRIVPDISNPLPLGGPPGQVTIQPQFFFNKDLEYLLTGDKERNRALSISKLKAALYQDFGLEELVPSLWIESEREYDISAAYGITHWWFSRKQFYINKHSEPSDRDAVRSHMRILSVIKKDFKSLHPNDFEDLNILHIQGKLDHLPKQDKLGIKSYQTKLNLEHPNRDASDFPFKEDYTIVFKPRAVIYRDGDDNRCGAQFNKGMENRKWTEDDKRRSEDFIEDNLKMEMEMEIPSVKASANSDIVYFFTSAQDGDPLQDDVRLCLADDLKKAQDHNQRQVNDESKDHYPKCTRYQMKNQIVLVMYMDPDELQSDLLALRRLYGLLINDKQYVEDANSENLDKNARQLLLISLNVAANKAFEAHAKMRGTQHITSYNPWSMPQEQSSDGLNPQPFSPSNAPTDFPSLQQVDYSTGESIFSDPTNQTAFPGHTNSISYSEYNVRLKRCRVCQKPKVKQLTKEMSIVDRNVLTLNNISQQQNLKRNWEVQNDSSRVEDSALTFDYVKSLALINLIDEEDQIAKEASTKILQIESCISSLQIAVKRVNLVEFEFEGQPSQMGPTVMGQTGSFVVGRSDPTNSKTGRRNWNPANELTLQSQPFDTSQRKLMIIFIVV